MHVESFHIRRRVMPPHRGALLVAEPFLDEGCFRRAVICLAEYSEKGAVGFVLNSPTRYVLSELLEGENDIPSIPVFCGGPVGTENNPHALMQTQWHIKIDCDWQTITHEITPRVRVIVDLSHAIRTIAKDGQAIDTCQFGPDILRHYQWLLRIAEDAEQVNTQNYG